MRWWILGWFNPTIFGDSLIHTSARFDLIITVIAYVFELAAGQNYSEPYRYMTWKNRVDNADCDVGQLAASHRRVYWLWNANVFTIHEDDSETASVIWEWYMNRVTAVRNQHILQSTASVCTVECHGAWNS